MLRRGRLVAGTRQRLGVRAGMPLAILAYPRLSASATIPTSMVRKMPARTLDTLDAVKREAPCSLTHSLSLLTLSLSFSLSTSSLRVILRQLFFAASCVTRPGRQW